MSFKNYLFNKIIEFSARKATGTTTTLKRDMPKLQRLELEKTELALKTTFLRQNVREIENTRPLNGYALYFKQKELKLAEKKLAEITKEYNSFKARQEAAQREFNYLNNL